ncbi:hypothetical protein BC829DRAFT_177334 [Chytridium lagenaria]|nr:hypothetical protein BC829DRAFT_177334 [Chytridium lagenaria]
MALCQKCWSHDAFVLFLLDNRSLSHRAFQVQYLFECVAVLTDVGKIYTCFEKMVSLQTLPVEIGEHIATYIRFDEVQILSKLSRHFRANWTFFTSFAFHVAYLKNPLNKNILDRSCFHLAHPTLIAAWLCHGDISDGMVSLTHCDSYPCMDRSKAEERTKSGQPCRRHSQRMTAALKVAMANGLPNEFLKKPLHWCASHPPQHPSHLCELRIV